MPPTTLNSEEPLLEAAVSGVVAGVCLSIANRLFGRR